MKNLRFIVTGIVAVFISVNVQAQKELVNPDEKIIVNKEYDEEGNLIGYDSTYSRSWSSDTSFHFNFDDKLIFGDSFPNLNDFFKGIFADSAKQNFGFPPNFQFSPFDDDAFFKKLNPSFNDSVFLKNFNIDSLHHFQNEFIFPDIKQLQEQINKQFENFEYPENPIREKLNEEQEKELKEMKKKHQEELEDLKKKWKEQK